MESLEELLIKFLEVFQVEFLTDFLMESLEELLIKSQKEFLVEFL